MQLELTVTDCGKTELLIKQEQGDSSPFVITFPFDITGYTFSGTINFPTPLLISLGSGLTALSTAYSAGRTYQVGERAYYLTIPYKCIKVSTGNLPTNASYWIADIAFGQVQLQLTSAQTQDIPAGQYPFDLWALKSGVNNDPLTGYFQINNAITRVS